MTVARFALAICVVLASIATPLRAQTFDVTRPPGGNFDKAQFRLWHPQDAAVVRAVLVLVPGSNSDGRGEVDDEIWQSLANRHGLALLGVHMTDRPHEQMFIEDYVDVKRGSGDALLQALDEFAALSGHGELGTVPLLFWGMSAGGQFNYEFALWKPERVLAFVVNKGGIYYSAQASPAAQRVPGMFFIGEKDLEFRNDIIAGIFAINRRAGALWALAVEPGVEHTVAGSKDMAVRFFDEVIPMRLPDGMPQDPALPLRALAASEGFIGDPKTGELIAASDAPKTTYPTSWLPSRALAEAWRQVISGTNQ